MATTRYLSAKKVIEEFNKRALKKDGVLKVLSDRVPEKTNKEFDQECKDLLKQYSLVKSKNILDVGTGMGRLAKCFAKDSKLIGIDFSSQMLHAAQAYLKGQKNVTLILNNAKDVNFLPGYFDLGIVSLVLKHNNTKTAVKIINNLKKWCKVVFLVEHIKGAETKGSDIAIIRPESWYVKQFRPMRPILTQKFKRHKDNILFCIFK